MFVTLTPKTREGADVVAAHGSVWHVRNEAEQVQFTPQPGPWILLESRHDVRWVHGRDDKNFLVEPALDLDAEQAEALRQQLTYCGSPVPRRTSRKNSLVAAISGLAGVLKATSGLLVFGFLIWSMYFTGKYELGLFRGFLAFVVLSIFSGVTSMIPFGTTFAPILFEWWWHDVPFWEFSAAAWSVTGISMLANILLVTGLFLSRKAED